MVCVLLPKTKTKRDTPPRNFIADYMLLMKSVNDPRVPSQCEGIMRPFFERPRVADRREPKRRSRAPLAARDIAERRSHDADFRPLPLHHGEQHRGIGRRDADAAMRRRAAEIADRIRAMNRVLAVEENGVRHRGVVVFGGMDHDVHRSRPEDAIWRCMTGLA